MFDKYPSFQNISDDSTNINFFIILYKKHEILNIHN